MDMTGEYRIAAPRERVWEALNDPDVLKDCIPGCESIEKVSDTEFTARVVAKVGPVKAKFGGKVTLSDLDPPNGYTITGEGSGGAAGFGKGGAVVRLVPDGADTTILAYEAHASVGGKLAQVGSRLIDATARKMADDFFACFANRLVPTEEAAIVAAEAGAGEASEAAAAAPTPTPAPTPAPAASPAAAPEPAPATESRGLKPIVWIPLVIIFVVLLLWAFIG